MSSRDSRTFRIAVRKYPPFERAIAAQWELFEAQHKTGLQLEAVPFELRELEETLFHDGGMRQGEWDVAFVSTDWIASMHADGAAYDLSSLLQENVPADYPEGWTGSLLHLQRIGRAVLGVPYHDGPECLMFRRDLFENEEHRAEYRARFKEELKPPSTWEQFHRIARFFNDPNRGLYGAVFAAFPDGHNSVYDFLLQLWSRGGELLDASGVVRFQTVEAVEALDFYRSIVADNDAVHPHCQQLDSVGAGQAFAAGQAAMMINWFGFATAAHTAEGSAVRGLVDIAPIPHAGHGTSVSLNVYWILSIAAGTPHAEIAYEFLRHTLSPAMDKLTTTSGAIGCRRSTWRDEEVNRAIPFYHRIESLHAHAREIPQRADWPRIAVVIDELITASIASDTPTAKLLKRADEQIAISHAAQQAQ